MRKRTTQSNDVHQIPLPDRIIAAVLVPLFFNLSIFLALSAFISYYRPRWVYFGLFGIPSFSYLVVFWILPALIGLALGTLRVANLLGHLFFTHTHPHDNDWRVTTGLWCLVIGLWVLASRWY